MLSKAAKPTPLNHLFVCLDKYELELHPRAKTNFQNNPLAFQLCFDQPPRFYPISALPFIPTSSSPTPAIPAVSVDSQLVGRQQEKILRSTIVQ